MHQNRFLNTFIEGDFLLQCSDNIENRNGLKELDDR